MPKAVAAAAILLVVLAIATPAIGLFRAGSRAARPWLISWLVALGTLLAAAVAAYLILRILGEGLAVAAPSLAKGELTSAESAAKILAFAAAALFLVVKLAAGYGLSNAKLSSAVSRCSSDPAHDLVSVRTTITSAGARSFQLLDVQMAALDLATGKRRNSPKFVVRGFQKAERLGDRLQLSDDRGALTLNPGDSIEVTGWAVVPKGQILPVDVTVLGFASTALSPEQWSSAVVSPPLPSPQPGAKPADS